MSNRKQEAYSKILGWTVTGSIISGIVGLIMAFVAAVSNEWIASSFFVIAAGISFGLLSRALFIMLR
ncbi:MAG: hypothetical protein PVG14_12760 [Anaerolineales bacterium]